MLTHGTGVVAEFDELRGLGVIRGDDGADVPFHCTAIADGSRTVETGRRVSYEVVPGLLGRWEASGVEKL
ncbi:MAG TPA: cold shock domain-containing protein [Acidimicrobiales bacterium]|nr:cold shock domain-containing protein [Acidimicrobiales bacterium]